MTKQSRTVLKGYFETDDQPTEAQFIDLIDSQVNFSDDGVMTNSSTGITAYAGGGQGSATQFSALCCRVDTVASAGDSIKPSGASFGSMFFIHNSGANPCDIFPPSGQNFEGLAADTAISLPVGCSVAIYYYSSNEWGVFWSASDLSSVWRYSDKTFDFMGPAATFSGVVSGGVRYSPFYCGVSRAITNICIYVSSATGNGVVDVGIYDSSGNRLVRSALNISIGVTGLYTQSVDRTALVGGTVYYLAMTGTSGTMPSVLRGQCSVNIVTSAAGVTTLPATFVPGANSPVGYFMTCY